MWIASAILVAVMAVFAWGVRRDLDAKAADHVYPGHARAYRLHTNGACAWEEVSPGAADLKLQSRCGQISVTVVAPAVDETPATHLARYLADTTGGVETVVIGQARVVVDGEPARRAELREHRAARVIERHLLVVRRDDTLYAVEIAYPVGLRLPGDAFAGVLEQFELPPAEPLPTTAPTPPLSLTPPARPVPADLARASDDELVARARRLRDAGGDDAETRDAIITWLMVLAARGEADVALPLARLNAGAGRIDAALYWLQRAAVDDGLDPEDLDDPDLAPVVADPRYGPARLFAARMRRYYRARPVEDEVVVVPEGYRPGTPIPTIVALHGYGAGPGNFIDGFAAAEIARTAGVAFVAVSAPQCHGPHHFAWTEDEDDDLARIDRALAKVRDRVTPGALVLLGFSQGAQLATAIAAHHPERFAGAIALSPGTLAPHALTHLGHALGGRRFVIAVGADESPGNVELAADDATRLRAAGAEVVHRPAAGQREHRFPVDLDDVMTPWIAYVLTGAPLPAGAR